MQIILERLCNTVVSKDLAREEKHLSRALNFFSPFPLQNLVKVVRILPQIPILS